MLHVCVQMLNFKLLHNGVVVPGAYLRGGGDMIQCYYFINLLS